jgi:hypothetical protein
VRSSPLDLKAICRGSSMLLYLDGAEVWKGGRFLGTVSADWLAAQIQDRLDSIEIAEWLRAELAAPHTRYLGPPLEETRPMLAPSYTPITRAVKAKRRQARQKGKGKRLTS